MKKTKSQGRQRDTAAASAPTARTGGAAVPVPAPASAPAPAIARDRDRRAWLLVVPIVALVAAAFWPILANGFVDWDDETNFTQNYHFRGIGWPQLRWAWTTLLLGVYQPVAWMILDFEYALWGIDPRGYHLASLVLHAGVGVALYALTLDLLARVRGQEASASGWIEPIAAATAVALFVVHPLRVEAVAWVSCQPYLPCALFTILAVLTYLRAHDADLAGDPRRRIAWLAASLVLYATALLSKAAAVPLAAVLVILDVYPLRRLGHGPGGWLGPRARRVWLEKIPFLVLCLAFVGTAIAAKARVGTLAPLEHDGLRSRVAQACYGVWFYLVKTFIPINIAAFYPLPARIDPMAPRFLLAIAATIGVTIGLFLLRQRYPAPLAAWLSYLVILAPSSGLVRIGNQIAADRYAYLSMMGLAVLLAAGLARLLDLASRRGIPAAPGFAATALGLGLALALALVPITRTQCCTWRDSEALWSHALAHGGRSAEVCRSLGEAYFRQGRLDRASELFDEAVRLRPGLSVAWRGRGAVASRRGRFDEAIAHFDEAIRLEPTDPIPHYLEGVVRFNQGRLDESLAQFNEAIRLDPEMPEPHHGVASVRARQGRYDEALAQFGEATRLRPDYGEAYNDLAMIRAACPDPRFRDGKAAVAAANAACDIAGRDQPDYLDTLAAAYAEAGEFNAAVEWQQQAIGLLTDEARKQDFRTRLALYQARRPFRTTTTRP